MFAVITAVTLLILFFLLTSHRFRGSRIKNEKDTAAQAKYSSWLLDRISALIRISWSDRLKELYSSWISQQYPARQRWIFIGLVLSFCYLVLSGFVFASTGIRLQGVFLLLHVVLGGLFAVCLGSAVILRSGYYTWDLEDFEGKKGALNLRTDAARRKIWKIVLFWFFTASGLVLIGTAFAQMLPYFSLRAQLVLFETHRYAALTALLAAIAFVYFSRIDERQ